MKFSEDHPPKVVGQEIAAQLFDALNAMGAEKEVVEGFMEEVSRTHRTLQQNSGRLLIAFINHFALMHDRQQFDLRNEALCKLCKALQPVVYEKTFGCDALPFV